MAGAHDAAAVGFRQLYERQLIEGHAWLVSCLLCWFLVAVLLEDMSLKGSVGRLLLEGTICFVAGALSIHGWQRYAAIMKLTNHCAEHSTCRQCGAYGRFAFPGAPARVKCRGCGNEWMIN